jgi:GH43 family beta-xylosidase
MRLVTLFLNLSVLLGVVVEGSCACLTDPMFQGQDPQIELYNHNYHLPQSDGCNIHLRRASSLSGLATAVNPIIYSPGCTNVWAPELHFLSNSWFLYYSADTGGNGNERVHVAQAGTNPFGPYTERGVLMSSYWNIDGSILSAPNGQIYFICSGSPAGTQTIAIAPMSNPYTLSGPLVIISTPDQSWEKNGSVNEGPYAIVRNGQVFIVYSASGCWTDDYCLGLLTLAPNADPLLPASWTKTGPVFTKQTGAYGPGHNCVFQDDFGQWWNVYHANNLTGQGCGGYRQVRLQRLFWNSNNTPYFGTPIPIGSLVTEDTNFLVCNFSLAETNGATASTSVCGPPGSLVGAPIWMNPGLKFNGSNDYVSCNPALGNDVQNTLTLAAWIKADAFIDWAGLITKGTNASPYAMQTWHDGSLRFTANWGTPPGYLGSGSWNSNTKMGVNQWYHVAVTYDGAVVRFYINGALDSNQPAVSLHFGIVNEPLTIGADLPGGDEYFSGTMRDVRLYGRALSDAEIGQIALTNHAPVLNAIASRTLTAGQTLTITNSATDPDWPPQMLAYALPTAPSNAMINSASGLLTWRPYINQSPSTNLLQVSVTDNGSPPLSATQNFQVTVSKPVTPLISSFGVSNSALSFAVTGDLGPDYALYGSTNLLQPSWILLQATNPASMPFLFHDPMVLPQRYYRIFLGP